MSAGAGFRAIEQLGMIAGRRLEVYAAQHIERRGVEALGKVALQALVSNTDR